MATQSPVLIEGNFSIAANSSEDNVLTKIDALRQLERAPWNCSGKFLAVQSAQGLLVDVSHGARNAVAESEMRVGVDLEEPLDVLNDQFFPRQGDELVIRVANPTSGAISIIFRLVLEYQPPDMATPPAAVTTSRGPIAIADATVDFDLFDSLRYKQLPQNTYMSIFMTASADGVSKRVNVGMVAIAPPSTIPVVNNIPQDPFNKMVEDVPVPGGELMQNLVTNQSGGSVNVFFRLKSTDQR